MLLKNRNINSKIKRSKITDYAALKCTYIGKNHFNFISVWSEIMSLKSDKIELGFSIVNQLSP